MTKKLFALSARAPEIQKFCQVYRAEKRFNGLGSAQAGSCCRFQFEAFEKMPGFPDEPEEQTHMTLVPVWNI